MPASQQHSYADERQLPPCPGDHLRLQEAHERADNKTQETARSDVATGAVPRITPRKPRIGLVAGGFGAYWPPSLGTGHRIVELEAVADLLGLELNVIRV